MKFAKISAPIQDHEQHRGGAHALDQDFDEHLQVSARRASAKHQRAPGADARALGRGEYAGVDPADHDENSTTTGQTSRTRLEPHRPGAALARGTGLRIARRSIHATARHRSTVATMPADAGREELAILVSVMMP